MESLEVFRPELKDFETVFGFWRAQHELHYNLDPVYYKPNSTELDKLAKEYFTKTITTDSPHILVAKFQNQLIGFVTFNEKKSDLIGIEAFASNCSSYVEVIDLFIDDKFRGKRMGEQLMIKAQEYCQKEGLPKMMVEVAVANSGAQRFYTRLGFVTQQVKMFKGIE